VLLDLATGDWFIEDLCLRWADERGVIEDRFTGAFRWQADAPSADGDRTLGVDLALEASQVLAAADAAGSVHPGAARTPDAGTPGAGTPDARTPGAGTSLDQRQTATSSVGAASDVGHRPAAMNPAAPRLAGRISWRDTMPGDESAGRSGQSTHPNATLEREGLGRSPIDGVGHGEAASAARAGRATTAESSVDPHKAGAAPGRSAAPDARPPLPVASDLTFHLRARGLTDAQIDALTRLWLVCLPHLTSTAPSGDPLFKASPPRPHPTEEIHP